MAAALDATGMRFGRLTAMCRLRSRNGQAVWRFACDCGSITEALINNARTGNTTSCGCVQRENRLTKRLTHGHAAGGVSPTYRSWRNARDRATRPGNPGYSRYGGAGIGMCAEWRTSFDAFLADMGERPPGMTLDRIDNAKGYEPGNCRWATTAMQVRNRKCARWVMDGNERLTLKEASAKYKVTPDSLWARIKAGQALEEAIPALKSRRPFR